MDRTQIDQTRYVLSEADLDNVRAQLRRHAQLFDRPNAYTAGVEDAVAALIARSREPRGVIDMPDIETEQAGSRML